MRCSWCDTPYSSWNPEGTHFSIEELILQARKFPQAKHIVVTGGEPFSFTQLPELINSFHELGYIITIETAGINYFETKADLISLSPKLSNSDPRLDQVKSQRILDRHVKLRSDYGSMLKFIDSPADIQWKFVVKDQLDLLEIEQMLLALKYNTKEQVYLMPYTENPAQFLVNLKRISQLCLDTGYSLSHRLQVELWKDERGT